MTKDDQTSVKSTAASSVTKSGAASMGSGTNTASEYGDVTSHAPSAASRETDTTNQVNPEQPTGKQEEQGRVEKKVDDSGEEGEEPAQGQKGTPEVKQGPEKAYDAWSHLGFGGDF